MQSMLESQEGQGKEYSLEMKTRQPGSHEYRTQQELKNHNLMALIDEVCQLM